MKKLFKATFAIALTSMLLFSCSKAEKTIIPDEDNLLKVTIIAGNPQVDPGTKTEIQGTTPYWSIGDAIGVSDGTTSNNEFTTSIESASSTATFTGHTVSGTLYAYYPYSSNGVGEVSGSTGAKVDIPANQNPTATSFDSSADVMVAKSFVIDPQNTTVSGLRFKRLGAVVKIVLKDNTAKHVLADQHPSVISLQTSGESDVLAGRQIVDMVNQSLGEIYHNGTNKVTANYTSSTHFLINSTNAAYFVVHPRNLAAGTTLTAAINDVNARLGEGFTEENTVAKALSDLRTELVAALTISLDVAGTPTSGYLKTYILSQGISEIGRIDIPKDLVVTSGSLVNGTWTDDTFTEDPEGPDTALKLIIANQEEPVYINTKDLVDYYTAGNGIDIDNTHNTIAIKLDASGEPFLTVGVDGLKLDGVQVAIDKAVNDAKLDGSDGISIASNKVKAVAAKFSASALKNPITVNEDGIKFASLLDCGFFDDITAVVSTAEEINSIDNPSETDVFINGDSALNALTTKKTFKNIEVSNVDANNQIYLYATDNIVVDGMEVTGDKGSTNGYVLYSAKDIEISNLSIANGSTAYNVFEGDQTNQNLEVLNASNVIVDNPSLTHNVFNVYKPQNDAVINNRTIIFVPIFSVVT